MKKKSDIYIKFSEKEIQDEIWTHRENLFELIDEPKFPNTAKSKEVNAGAWEILYGNVLEAYEEYYSHLEYLEFFAKEVPLEKKNDSTIRADFLGFVGGGHGIAICELKKSNQAERQAFTELFAYANHVSSKFAPMGKRDVFHILISPMQERIVREATIKLLVYDGLKIIAVIPYFVDENDIHSLRFKVWIPNKKDFDLFSKATFLPENFHGIRIAWKGEPDVWIPSKKHDNPDAAMRHRMNQLTTYAAQQMEAMGLNGFVFTSQKWSEIADRLYTDCFLTIFCLNPYKASVSRKLSKYCDDVKDLRNITISEVPLNIFFPSLTNRKSYVDEYNYLEEMAVDWGNDVANVVWNSCRFLTRTVYNRDVLPEYEEYDWESFQRNPFEDKYCHNFDIVPTGLIRLLYDNHIQSFYQFVQEENLADDYVDRNMIKENVVDMYNDQYYFRKFLKELWGEYEEI